MCRLKLVSRKTRTTDAKFQQRMVVPSYYGTRGILQLSQQQQHYRHDSDRETESARARVCVCVREKEENAHVRERMRFLDNENYCLLL